MSIHHSKNILNPYVYGFSLNRGFYSLFRLTKTVKWLLPASYDTNCRDYLTEWENKGGRGPTTEKECIEECERNSSMEIYGCIVDTLQGPTNERVCRDNPKEAPVLKTSQDCAVKYCRPACHEITYEVAKDTRGYLEDQGYCVPPALKKEMMRDFVAAIIKLDGLQTTVYSYSPKFENIEIFSYIGGYIGMWLGISLIALFDFLETMLGILRYPIRKLFQPRERKHRVENLVKRRPKRCI